MQCGLAATAICAGFQWKLQVNILNMLRYIRIVRNILTISEGVEHAINTF